MFQPFFGIVGTAVTVIGASSILRVIVNAVKKAVMARAIEEEEGDTAESPAGLGFGVFEYAVIKTAHLGLCQVCV